MTVETAPLTSEEVGRLLPDALQRPAPEGARIVALSFLHQLLEARSSWQGHLCPAPGEPKTTPPPMLLHSARVALRRLRATVREHERVLDGAVDRRTMRHLRALGQATNAPRDADVQREWLDAQFEHLTPAARTEARQLREQLTDRPEEQAARVEAAFVRHLDPIAETLTTRLSTWTQGCRVGRASHPMPFARHVSARLARSGVRLRRELAHVTSVADQDAMHAARIRLKRQRALLAPFARTRPAIGAWFDQATRGQDLLGAIRDAHLLARRAAKAELPNLARAIEDSVLGHVSALRHDWIEQDASVLAVLERTIAVLRSEGSSATATGLPMEIERKYLLRDCPPHARTVGPMRIEQGWLPGQQLRERLRRRIHPDGTVDCWRTVKLGPMEARIEIEEATPLALFEAMWPLTHQARIRKDRYVVAHGPHRWEIDVFLDRDLVLAEVELDEVHEVAEFPAWLAPFVERDVTTDPAYLNSELARIDPAADE